MDRLKPEWVEEAMRSKALVILAVAVSTISVTAWSADDMSNMKDMGTQQGQPSTAQKHSARGVVKKVDTQAGQVTLQHGPVKSLNWPAMTMAFRVNDKAMMDKLKVGKKVQFEFVQQGSDYVVTGVK